MRPEKRPDPDQSLESLEARLRALPQPRVPDDLEARLLATLSARTQVRSRRRAVWIGLAGATAAACFFVVLAWPPVDGEHPLSGPGTNGSMPGLTIRQPNETDDPAAWPDARRRLDRAHLPPFSWPLPKSTSLMVSTPIPPDLLD